MRVKPKFVILFYDHCDKALPMQQLLQQLPTPVETVCVEKVQQLFDAIHVKSPDIIIVYVNNSATSYIDYLKSLRLNNGIDEIPVYAFTELPEKQTIIELLSKN
jgi:DNA-binding NarL/FixJ family response regulator